MIAARLESRKPLNLFSVTGPTLPVKERASIMGSLGVVLIAPLAVLECLSTAFLIRRTIPPLIPIQPPLLIMTAHIKHQHNYYPSPLPHTLDRHCHSCIKTVLYSPNNPLQICYYTRDDANTAHSGIPNKECMRIAFIHRLKIHLYLSPGKSTSRSNRKKELESTHTPHCTKELWPHSAQGPFTNLAHHTLATSRPHPSLTTVNPAQSTRPYCAFTLRNTIHVTKTI